MSIKTSNTEENYLKAIYKLSDKFGEQDFVNTNAISEAMQTKAASVTDMIKKLSEKKLLYYKPYKGVQLNEAGTKIATSLIRKHRLWEVFLVDKLNYKWDEIHPIAEQLEHIRSENLIDRLDEFLEFPKFDPHGDPIPDKEGIVKIKSDILLSDLKRGEEGVIVGVKQHSTEFLNYLDNHKLVLGTKLKIIQIIKFDDSILIKTDTKGETNISNKVSKNLYVQLLPTD